MDPFGSPSQPSRSQGMQRRVNNNGINQGAAMSSMQRGVNPAGTTGRLSESQVWLNPTTIANYGGGQAVSSANLQCGFASNGHSNSNNSNVFDYNTTVGNSSISVARPTASYGFNTPASNAYPTPAGHTFQDSAYNDPPHVASHARPVSPHYIAGQNVTTWIDPTANSTTGASRPLTPSPHTSPASRSIVTKQITASGIYPERHVATHSNLARTSLPQTHGQSTYDQLQPIRSSSLGLHVDSTRVRSANSYSGFASLATLPDLSQYTSLATPSHNAYAYYKAPTEPVPITATVTGTPRTGEKATEYSLHEQRSSSPDIQELAGPPSGFVAKRKQEPSAAPALLPTPVPTARGAKQEHMMQQGAYRAGAPTGFIPKQRSDRSTELPTQDSQPPAKKSRLEDATPKKRTRTASKKDIPKAKLISASAVAATSAAAACFAEARPSTVIAGPSSSGTIVPAEAFVFGQPAQKSSTGLEAKEVNALKASRGRQPAQVKEVTEHEVLSVADPLLPTPAPEPSVVVASTAEGTNTNGDNLELEHELREGVAKLPTTRRRQPRKKATDEPKKSPTGEPKKNKARASRAKKDKEVPKKDETATALQAVAPSTSSSSIPNTAFTFPLALPILALDIDFLNMPPMYGGSEKEAPKAVSTLIPTINRENSRAMSQTSSQTTTAICSGR